mmetsp:Transcript_19211/g.18351  ORF Transcript_19211/g.18351 Transcript_19211/m.18351 type:complete len:147 (+) Transcript_19211:70-510(+)
MTDGIVGMQNYSYYCYLNSCLQCLLAIDHLRDHYMNREFRMFKEKNRVKNSFRLSLAFAKFFIDVWIKKNTQNLGPEGRKSFISVVSPDLIKTEIYTRFSPVYQHDCHEFFTYIMSTLQDEETPTLEQSQNENANLNEEVAWNFYE